MYIILIEKKNFSSWEIHRNYSTIFRNNHWRCARKKAIVKQHCGILSTSHSEDLFLESGLAPSWKFFSGYKMSVLPPFPKMNIYEYHMNVYHLQSTRIINYSEAVNKNIICPNNLMFSNNTKCSNRNVCPKEFA